MTTRHSPIQMYGLGECGCPKREDYTSMHGQVDVYHTKECIEWAERFPTVKALREQIKRLAPMSNFIRITLEDVVVVPYVRVPHSPAARSLDVRTQRYFINQEMLAMMLRSEKARRKMRTIDKPVAVGFILSTAKSTQRADVDNILKAVLDALVKGTWIKDDRQVKALLRSDLLEDMPLNGLMIDLEVL